jgi:hypothetical protein
VAEEPARNRLKHLLGPALGFLDTRALLGVGGEQRPLGAHVVKDAGDPPRALDLAPVQLQRRHISLTRRCGMRLWAIIHSAAAAAFEIGIP